MGSKKRLQIDWPNVAIVFGALTALSGITLLLA
jgi:hypothetical protein